MLERALIVVAWEKPAEIPDQNFWGRISENRCYTYWAECLRQRSHVLRLEQATALLLVISYLVSSPVLLMCQAVN